MSAKPVREANEGVHSREVYSNTRKVQDEANELTKRRKITNA
jgi:hypothetical protein